MKNYPPSTKSQPALVFLPGWGFKATIWDSVSRQLSQYNLCFVDFPFFEPGYANKTLDDITLDLSKIMPDHSIILAWSLGGLLAMHLCEKYPHKCRQIITIAASPKFVAAEAWAAIPQKIIDNFKKAATLDIATLLKKFQKRVIYPSQDKSYLAYLNQYLADDLTQQKLLFYLKILENADIRNVYAHLPQPIHIFGGKDAILPIQVADEMKKINPSSIIEIIPEAGHIPFLSHPVEFLTILEKYFNRE